MGCLPHGGAPRSRTGAADLSPCSAALAVAKVAVDVLLNALTIEDRLLKRSLVLEQLLTKQL